MTSPTVDVLRIADVPVERALDALEAALLVLLYPKQATWALEPDPLAGSKRCGRVGGEGALLARGDR